MIPLKRCQQACCQLHGPSAGTPALQPPDGLVHLLPGPPSSSVRAESSGGVINGIIDDVEQGVNDMTGGNKNTGTMASGEGNN